MGAGHGDVAIFAGGYSHLGLSSAADVYTVEQLEHYRQLYLRGVARFRQEGEQAFWWSSDAVEQAELVLV